jgi:hypothetical protein
MAVFELTNHFNVFFGRLNPGASFETTASREYNSIKALIEDRNGLARELRPRCFLQGSYKQDTAIYTINDVDIVALCEELSQGEGPGGGGRTYTRDEIFDIVAAPLLNDGRYRDKVRYHGGSMCIKVDLGIKVEILPAVYKRGNNDFSKEPFRIYRPGKGWDDGYARYHQAWLSYKNRDEATGGNFIPAIKVLKHLRSHYGLDAVSFHIECLLFSLPDAVFRGSRADSISQVLNHIAATSVNTWYGRILPAPCGDGRDIFTGAEWSQSSWEAFHRAVTVWARGARIATQALQRVQAVEAWQVVLGDTFFPRDA